MRTVLDTIITIAVITLIVVGIGYTVANIPNYQPPEKICSTVKNIKTFNPNRNTYIYILANGHLWEGVELLEPNQEICYQERK